MPYLTNEDVEQRKAAGVKMNKLNCGWNLPAEIIARIATRIAGLAPQTEVERRDQRILELAFIQDMNPQQIARLHDPLIVGMGNRNHGEPLSPKAIWSICTRFAPEVSEYRKAYHVNRAQDRRNALYLRRQRGEIARPAVCATCGSGANIEQHHIIPLEAGGTDDYYNLISLCHDCHMKLHHAIYDRLQWRGAIPKHDIIE